MLSLSTTQVYPKMCNLDMTEEKIIYPGNPSRVLLRVSVCFRRKNKANVRYVSAQARGYPQIYERATVAVASEITRHRECYARLWAACPISENTFYLFIVNITNADSTSCFTAEATPTFISFFL